jgi:hypothetical protein
MLNQPRNRKQIRYPPLVLSGCDNTFGAPQPGYPRGLVQTSSYLSINSIHENVAYKETAPLGKDHWIHLPSLKLVLS